MAIYQNAIDTSRYQGHINIEKLYAQHPAMWYMKATDGISYVDPLFIENRAKAIQYSIPYAPYHYFQPRYDGKLQAQWFYSHILPTEEPPVVDIEESYGIPAGYVQRVLDCLLTLETLTGKRPTIYTRSSYWKLYLSAAYNWAFHYRLWVAHYTDKIGPSVCLPWDPANWYIWQYGTPAFGQLYGMQTLDLDCSVFNVGGPIGIPISSIGVREFLQLAREPIPQDAPRATLADLWNEFKAQRRKNYRRA